MGMCMGARHCMWLKTKTRTRTVVVWVGRGQYVAMFKIFFGGSSHIDTVKDFNNVHNASMTALDGGGPQCPERRRFRDGPSDYDQPVKNQDPNPGYKHLWPG